MLKWTLGVGTALGLRPWKIFEVNESIFGSAFAAEQACRPVNRLVANVMGDGGFAWMTQLYPFTAQATQGGESAFYATGQAVDQLVEPGDRPMKLSPDAPRLQGKRVTGFLCGTNEAHTRRPSSATRLETGVSMLAAAAALQMMSPSLVPSIAVGDQPVGSAAGAPAMAAVPSALGMVELFAGTAASAGGVLSGAGDGALFEAAYKANLGLHRAAGRPTVQRGLLTAKSAAGLLARSYGDALRPTAADLARYGVDEASSPPLLEMAQALICTAKAFKLNLTSSVLVPGTNDDPHRAFDDLPALEARVRALARLWDAFLADLAAEPDPLCAGQSLAEGTVVVWLGDTGKHPNVKTAWPDSTPRLANWMYVLGNGHLRSGWFGEILAGENNIERWDPRNGQPLAGGTAAEVAELAAPASAAVLYAVAKGRQELLAPYYRGAAIDGVIKR